MKKLFFIVLALFWLSACQKHNFDRSADKLSITIDADTGVVLARSSGDTFLIRLKNPDANLATVPLTYTLPEGARPSSGVRTGVTGPGSRIENSTWQDVVDLHDNKVFTLTVTAADGHVARYAIAFEYIVENHPLYSLDTKGLFLKGDTLYAATYQGSVGSSINALYVFAEGAGSLTSLGALGPHSVYPFTYSVYAQGNSVYAGLSDALAISRDGGKTFSNHLFKAAANINNGSIEGVTGIAVQGDTIYASTVYGGVFISRDGGASFDPTTNGLNPGNGYPSVYDISVNGSMVYAATGSGLSISIDGGRSFTVERSLADAAGKPVLCSKVYVDKNILYVATSDGPYFSADGGKSFAAIGSDAGERNFASSIWVENGIMCVGYYNGLAVSYDGGLSFIHYGAKSGFESGVVESIVMKGTTIYCGTQSYLTILRPRG